MEDGTLACGCRFSKTGDLYFFNSFCEVHVKETYDEEGKFSYKKTETLTNLLNQQVKILMAGKEAKLEELSEKEREAYEYIKASKEALAISKMPLELQGAVGKLKQKGLVQIYRDLYPRTSCVKIT